MDPVTHALSGLAIHQIGFKRKAALFVLVFSAVAPDLDYITRLWGADVFLRYHRGITHGILALFAFPLIMGAIFRNKGGFFYYYFLSFIAYGLHLFFDLTNPYGIRILSPLDWNLYSLDLMFVIDPFIGGGLLLCIIMGRMNKKKAPLIAICIIILMAAYIGGRAHLQSEAKGFLKTEVDANIYRLYPLPLDPLRWWFIAKSGSEIETGSVDLFTKSIYIKNRYRLDKKSPAIVESKKERVVQNFLYFARFPYAEVKREGDRTIVTWKELSFSFLPGERFIATVVMDKDGRVIESGFRF
jgi:inner membrane protein